MAPRSLQVNPTVLPHHYQGGLWNFPGLHFLPFSLALYNSVGEIEFQHHQLLPESPQVFAEKKSRG